MRSIDLNFEKKKKKSKFLSFSFFFSSFFFQIAKLEQRIASMQSASALKCITCQPLLSKVQKYEKKLKHLTEERIVQLEDLRQMK